MLCQKVIIKRQQQHVLLIITYGHHLTVIYQNVCSSLVAHLGAVAVIEVRFPPSCQILYVK